MYLFIVLQLTKLDHINIYIVSVLNTVDQTIPKDNNEAVKCFTNISKDNLNCRGAVAIERVALDTNMSVDYTIFVKYVTRTTTNQL